LAPTPKSALSADFLVASHSKDADGIFTNVAFDVTVANPLKASAVNQTADGNSLFAANNLFDKKLLKYANLAPGVKIIPLAFQSLGGHREEVNKEIKMPSAPSIPTSKTNLVHSGRAHRPLVFHSHERRRSADPQTLPTLQSRRRSH
jgi:hypothetical protein